MSIKDEVTKLISAERRSIESLKRDTNASIARNFAESRRLIESLTPTLEQLADAVDDSSFRVVFRERFAGEEDVTTIVCVGDVVILEEGSASDVGYAIDGRWWSFWPCFDEAKRVSWSFCDGPSRHEWFDSISDLMACLIPSVTKEIAIRQYSKSKHRNS